MSSFMTDYVSVPATDIKALHHPDGREIDVKSLLQHVKDIILFSNEEQEEQRMVTSKEVPPLTWCKSLLIPLEKLMRDISMRDDMSAVAVSILKELQPYAWGAKAVLVLTSFAMNHGLWMLAQMYSASPPSLNKVKDNNKLYSVLSRVLSKGSELDAYYFYLSLILSFSKRPKENTLPKPALTSLFQAIVRVIECIIELQDLPSEDLRGNITDYEKTMADIPIIVYNVITMVIYCAAVINQFPYNDYEISEAENNKLSQYASQMNESVKGLSKVVKDCNQFLEETKYDKEYQIPIPETSRTNNREALEYLIKSGDDPKLLNAAVGFRIWFFWSRLRSMLISKMSHQNRQESEDRMTRQLKWLLGYETERDWALLAKGSEVVTHGPESTILQALAEYETKKVGEYGGSFEDEFEKLHKKVVSSGRPVCCQVEFPVWSSGMPETMRCPQSNCTADMMNKSIVFECCHHYLLPVTSVFTCSAAPTSPPSPLALALKCLS